MNDPAQITASVAGTVSIWEMSVELFINDTAIRITKKNRGTMNSKLVARGLPYVVNEESTGESDDVYETWQVGS